MECVLVTFNFMSLLACSFPDLGFCLVLMVVSCYFLCLGFYNCIFLCLLWFVGLVWRLRLWVCSRVSGGFDLGC